MKGLHYGCFICDKEIVSDMVTINNTDGVRCYHRRPCYLSMIKTGHLRKTELLTILDKRELKINGRLG